MLTVISSRNLILFSRTKKKKLSSRLQEFLENVIVNFSYLHPFVSIRKTKGFLCFQGVEEGCIGNKWVKASAKLANSSRCENELNIYVTVDIVVDIMTNIIQYWNNLYRQLFCLKSVTIMVILVATNLIVFIIIMLISITRSWWWRKDWTQPSSHLVSFTLKGWGN